MILYNFIHYILVPRILGAYVLGRQFLPSFNLSTALPLCVLLLHSLLIRRVPLGLRRVAHVLDPAARTRSAGALKQLTALRVVVSGLSHLGLAEVLGGRLDCCAVGGIGGGLMHAAVAGSLAVGSCAAGGVANGGAGESGGGHGGCLGWVVSDLVGVVGYLQKFCVGGEC